MIAEWLVEDNLRLNVYRQDLTLKHLLPVIVPYSLRQCISISSSIDVSIGVIQHKKRSILLQPISKVNNVLEEPVRPFRIIQI